MSVPEMGTMVGTVGIVVAGMAVREVGVGIGDLDVEFCACWRRSEANVERYHGVCALKRYAAVVGENMALLSEW